jgi:hypothetical protein
MKALEILSEAINRSNVTFKANPGEIKVGEIPEPSELMKEMFPGVSVGEIEGAPSNLIRYLNKASPGLDWFKVEDIEGAVNWRAGRNKELETLLAFWEWQRSMNEYMLLTGSRFSDYKIKSSTAKFSISYGDDFKVLLKCVPLHSVYDGLICPEGYTKVCMILNEVRDIGDALNNNKFATNFGGTFAFFKRLKYLDDILAGETAITSANANVLGERIKFIKSVKFLAHLILDNEHLFKPVLLVENRMMAFVAEGIYDSFMRWHGSKISLLYADASEKEKLS